MADEKTLPVFDTDDETPDGVEARARGIGIEGTADAASVASEGFTEDLQDDLGKDPTLGKDAGI